MEIVPGEPFVSDIAIFVLKRDVKLQLTPRGTPPPGELNTRGVAKYSGFGPIDGYISETVQDRRQVSINH